MNRKTRYILLLLIVKTTFSFSQTKTMDNTTKEIMLQGKEVIITHALAIIKEKTPVLEFKPKDYEITVWANKYEALVKFRRLIKYYPKNKEEEEEEEIVYDFSVNIMTQETDIWSIDDFYTLTKQDLKNIEFVKEHFGLPSTNEFEINIYEDEDQFSINLDNEVAFGRYFIEKKTGKENHPSIQSSYTPMPAIKQEVDEDRLKEILDSTTQNEILDIISTIKSEYSYLNEFIEITDILSVSEFEKVKNFILKKGDGRTYRNLDNYNPHYHFDDFHAYLNSEIGQKNMNNDPKISDFNEITLHNWNEAAFGIQYYTIKIVRKGDIKNELIYVEDGMKESSIYLLNKRRKTLDLMLKNLKEYYLVKLRNQINTNR